MENKYINKSKDIAHCPFCRGVLLKNFKVEEKEGVITFTTRCPHCQKDVEVVIHKDLIVRKAAFNIYREFLDHLDFPVVIFEPKENFLFVNSAADDLLTLHFAKKTIVPENIADKDFLPFLIHQLRTPLTNVRWLSELLLQNYRLDEEAKSKVKKILISVQTLIDLVNDMLLLSQIQVGKLSKVFSRISMFDFLNKIIENFSVAADKNSQKLVFEPSVKDVILDADSSLLNAAISNLIDNAITYSPKGSEIAIDYDSGGDNCVISVHNSGPAIPQEEQRSLFSKFFRAETAKKIKPQGSGLGLYIAKSIVEIHNGDIWCESNSGSGTTFFIRLPFAVRDEV